MSRQDVVEGILQDVEEEEEDDGETDRNVALNVMEDEVLVDDVAEEDIDDKGAELEDEAYGLLEISRHFLCRTFCFVWNICVELKYISQFCNLVFSVCVFVKCHQCMSG